MPSAPLPLPPAAPLKNLSAHYINPLFAPFFLMLLQAGFFSLQWILGHSSLPGNDLANSLAKVFPSHLLFPPNAYLTTSIGDMIYNLVSSNIKSRQYLLRSLPSLAPLAVFSLVYAATGTALYLLHTFTGLVKLKLLSAASAVLNHRTSSISCYTALYLTLYVWPSLGTPSLFGTFGLFSGGFSDC